MAACFKLPSLVKKSKPHSQWPEFKWSEVNVEKLGCGSFGSVYLVKYEKEDRRNVIVKKMKGESAEARRRFEKEAAILNTVKGYRNVSEFLRFCTEPYAIMMEQAYFDFTPLGAQKQVNTLEDFLHFVDAEFDFTSFQMFWYFVQGTLLPDWSIFTRTISPTEILSQGTPWSAINITADRMMWPNPMPNAPLSANLQILV